MGAGDIISPGNQILALTAKKAIPKSATIAKGKIFVLIKPKDSKLIKSIITFFNILLKIFLRKYHLYLDFCLN